MLKLVDGIVELYKKVASSVPPDIEKALVAACEVQPPDSPGRETLTSLIDRIRAARTAKRPVCGDAGIPVFWIKIPKGLSQKEIGEIIIEGTVAADKKIGFHAAHVMESLVTSSKSGNAVDIGSAGYPVIYFEEYDGTSLVIDLLLNGADCENAGRLFSLTEKGLTIGGEIQPRGYEAILNCIEETVAGALGKICSPLVAAVGAASVREQAVSLSKRQLMRKLTAHESGRIGEFENHALAKMNATPNGQGLSTTVMGVKMSAAPMHPDSFFVDVTISCWALRRGRLVWS